MSWILIQQDTFTAWVNTHVSKSGFKCADMTKDFSNGLQVIALVENLSGKSVGRYNKNPRVPVQKIENLAIALKFCEAEGIKLVNISGEDIAGGDAKIILGFVWTLFKHWQYTQDKQELLDWIRAKIPEYNIKDFTGDWADGRAICALVNAMAPELKLCPDHQKKDPKTAVANANEGIELANEYFDVPKVLSGKHMCAKSPDEKSNMLYLSYFPKAKLRAVEPAAPEPVKEAPVVEVKKVEAKKAEPAKSAPAAAVSPAKVAEQVADMKIAAEAPAPAPAFKIKVKKNQAQHSMAFGPGLVQGVINRVSQFSVETPNTKGQGELKVVAKFIGTPAAEYPVNIKEVKLGGKGMFLCDFTPTKKGGVNVSITVGGEHVPGSTFVVPVLSEVSIGGEGKIMTFYSTTHGNHQTRDSDRKLQNIFEMKKIHLRPDFVPWVPVDIMDQADRDAVFEKAGTKKLPIVYVDDKYVGGWEEIEEMNENGTLDDLLRMDKYYETQF